MRVLSGIQPSGAIHLGNYFAMMKPAIERAMRSELEPAKEKARGIILKMVYSRPENPKTPRSNNLWLSTETTQLEEGGMPVFYVHNDPAKAILGSLKTQIFSKLQT